MNTKKSTVFPIRLSDEDVTILARLKKRLGLDGASVIRLAIRKLDRSESPPEKKVSK